MIGNIVILIASLLATYYVVIIRKRREMFVTLIPSCFIFCSAFAIPSFWIKLTVGDSPWIVPLAAVNIFFSLIGYWFFAAEIFKTSLILPKLFKETKQEWMHKDI